MLFIIICILTVILVIYDIYLLLLKFLVKNNDIDKNDQDKYIYYHNLLNDLSIAEIGYLYNNGRNINTLVKATLENIKLKKYTNLTYPEKYVFDCYKFMNTTEFKQRFLNYIKADLKNKGYIEIAKFKKNLIFPSLLMASLLVLNLFNHFISSYYGDPSNEVVFLFIMDWILICFSLLVVFRNEYLTKTEKGKETYLKIRALKRYINDFGNFDDRELEEIKLWDEWILYAIILDESDNLTKDLKEEYENIMEGINDNN